METEREFNDALSELNKNSVVKECFYHKANECQGKIKNAHSISRAGRLDLITGLVNKNEVVYSLGELILENGEKRKGLKEVGITNVASTFKGFCDWHDSELFKPLENGNDFNGSVEHCFLHSYRSFAYSYFQVKKSLKLAEFSLNNVSKLVDEISPVVSDKLNNYKGQLANYETKDIPFPKEEIKKQMAEKPLPKMDELKKSLEQKLGKDAEVLSHFNIDKINSFNNMLNEQKISLHQVQDFAGHRYASATQQYRRQDVGEKKRILRQYHPMSKMF